ncbi:phosphohydrolase [uncultured Clostridium sp.]|uniref:phosphohydrolase n=1 Tax=uncultured Clostridium sp. TaxID=59620 RepID=UPI0025CE62B1|nr:phosphohydrolase [uncultured Clostridium sp.]
MLLNEKEIDYYMECIEEFMNLEEYRSMSEFIQHGKVSCLEHSLSVSYYSYLISKKFHINVDARSLIRGAALHDFFLYDWHIKEGRKGWHGFRHPKIAYENAIKYFDINDIEKDIILKHMWPLTIKIPRCKEAFIVTFVDKMCSLAETFRIYPSLISP